MSRKWILGGLVLVAAVVGGWYVASPMIALKNMQAAVNSRDADALSAQIDFPALREDLKAEMSASMLAKAQTANGHGTAEAMLSIALVNNMIDGSVTPAGVKMMMANAGKGAGASNARSNGVPDLEAFSSFDFEIERNGFSEFKVRNKAMPTKGAAIFRREGLSWKLAGFDGPADGSGKWMR